MDGDGISLVIALFALICLSSYFSATETAFTSFNKIRIKNLANMGDKKAQSVLDISEKYDKLLSTILIGNNIVNITSASLATILFTRWFPNSGVTVSTVVMTVLVLIFGEITPKTLAKEYPEKFVLATVGIIKFFSIILAPLNFVFSLVRKVLDKLIKKKVEPSITEEELKTIIDEVESEGVINKHESELIRSAIEFDDVNAEDIYTPRIDVIAIEENDSLEHVKQIFVENGFSRLPVYKETIDHIVGVIHEKDFYKALSKEKSGIKSIISNVLYVMPNKKISSLLRELQQSKTHMAIVVDEYGGTEGLVTLEDIIEELVGDIWDEHDEILTHFRKLDDNKYIVSCNADIEDMVEYLELGIDYDDDDYSTVNGWVVKNFDRIPEEGDLIEIDNLKITVTKAESKRVNEICVQKF
ncbi:HlyC/CorC family transporter [Sedimentibacter sp. zth1]|uniref:HlyC/CorC family transporter n=1 Tax=Sedimentibacter sp. zth1 TaxID=2816908 RepID=UPI001A9399A3|nr:hemolysin family protein [Sedimentibacter sp. zth1]QSX07141.1 HlyC/CorC family transporter [Sedimentibacter sp. zth1]